MTTEIPELSFWNLREVLKAAGDAKEVVVRTDQRYAKMLVGSGVADHIEDVGDAVVIRLRPQELKARSYVVTDRAASDGGEGGLRADPL